MRTLPRLPLGRRLRIETRLTRKEARRAARALMDQAPGRVDEVWGLAIGPVIFMQAGLVGSPPALMAWMRERRGKLEVVGAAGVNLGGLALIALACIIGLALGLFVLFGRGNWHVLAAVLACCALLHAVAWANHAFRADAERLVRLLETALGPARPVPMVGRKIAFPAQTAVPMALDVSGKARPGATTPAQVRHALRRVAEDQDGFVILAIAEEVYLQAAREGDGFRLEKRESGAGRHFMAIRASETGGPGPATFALAKVEEAFAAYCRQAPPPPGQVWREHAL